MYFDAAPSEAIPCFRVGSRVLVRRSVFDAWLEQFSSRGRPSLAKAMQAAGLAPTSSPSVPVA
jgi:hypothetical protein